MLSIRQRRLAVLAAASALGAPLLGATLATATRGVDPDPVWIFEKIAATGDPAHNLNRPFETFFGAHIDGDSVVFSALFDPNQIEDDGDEFSAAYVRMNGFLRAAATPANSIPGHPGQTFDDVRGYGIDGDTMSFLAFFGAGDVGVYKFKYPNSRTLIADQGDPVPPSGTFLSFLDVSSDDGATAFFAAESLAESGLYLYDGSTISLLVDTTVVPPGSATPFAGFGGLSLRSGVVAFYGATGVGANAVYKLKNATITRVAHQGTNILNSAGIPTGATFDDFSVPVIDSLENIAFFGNDNGSVVGVYRVRPGALPLPVADLSSNFGAYDLTAFDAFAGPSIDMGGVVFSASTAAVQCGLYTDLGGSPKRVLAAGDVLDGKTVSTVEISRQALSKRTIVMVVGFDDDTQAVYTATLQTVVAETEPNNDPADPNTIEILCDPQYISGKLQANPYPECRPDTLLVVFAKDGTRINWSTDDPCKDGTPESSSLDDLVLYVPPAAPVLGDGGSGFVNNGDGTRSLRLGVSGFPEQPTDAYFDGMFGGSSSNSPHTQRGGFTLCVTWKDNGSPLPSPVELPDGTLVPNPQMYADEFFGGDAFRINFTVPIGVDAVDVCLDNSTGRVDVCNDVDFFLLTNLIPNCPYCVEQVGGIDEDCQPTDGLLGWIAKTFELIDCDDDGGAGVYAALCGENQVIADVNGRALIAFTGTGDKNFNGLKDSLEDAYLALHPEYLLDYPGVLPLPPAPLVDLSEHAATGGARAAEPDCVDVPPGHMICGCYTLCVSLEDHGGLDETEQRLADAMHHGDLNMDGVTNTADLGLLLGWFGWSSPN